MADDHSTDIGMPPEPMRDSGSDASQYERSSTPIAKLGAERQLKDVVLENLIDPREPTFRLKEDSERAFATAVARHYITFSRPDVTARETLAWQKDFISFFGKQVRDAAGGEEEFAALDDKQRSALIQAEADQFVAETRNSQALLSISRFAIETLEAASDTRIDGSGRLDISTHHEDRRTVSDGPAANRYDRGTGVARAAGSVARKLIGPRAGQAIGLSPTINNALQDAGLPRIETHILQTTLEAERQIHENTGQSLVRTTNKETDFTVRFPDAGARIATLAGLTDPQKRLALSYGLVDGADYERSGLMKSLERDLLDLTEARVDFYTATKMDIGRVRTDFHITIPEQVAHTSIEHLIDNNPAIPAVDKLARTNEAGMRQARETLTRRLRENYDRSKLQEDRDAIAEQILAHSRSRSEAEAEADKKRLEKDKKDEEERLKRAVARETLEAQRKAAELALKAAKDSYGTEVIRRDADREAYGEWPAELKAQEARVVELEAQEVEFTEAAATLASLEKSLGENITKLAGIKSAPDAQANQNNQDEDEEAPKRKRKSRKDAGGTIPPSTRAQDTINGEIRRLTNRIAALQARFPDLDDDGDVKLDARRRPILIDIAERKRTITAQLVRERAKRDAMKTGPAEMDEATRTKMKTWRDNEALITDISNRLTIGLDDGTFEQESSEVIQKRITAITERLLKVTDANEYSLHRKEAYTAVQQYMFSTEGRTNFRANVELLRAGADNLPMPRSEYYNNWPRAQIRIYQGLFGNRAIGTPDVLMQVARALPPEKALDYYNEFHGTRHDAAFFMRMDPALITAADLEYMWNKIRSEAVDSKRLGFIEPAEVSVLEGFKTVDVVAEDATVDQTVLQQLDQAHFYYRDVADLQLRILMDWAIADGNADNAYLRPLEEWHKEKIKWAAKYAQEIDARRKQRQLLFYGNAEQPAPTIVPVPEPESESVPATPIAA